MDVNVMVKVRPFFGEIAQMVEHLRMQFESVYSFGNSRKGCWFNSNFLHKHFYRKGLVNVKQTDHLALL
ncbi:hypothetical protein BAS10_04565 [Elizabethkingia meningoseptica]|nr:hypothetical protein BAS10_04565 [Elizabethkingia meningoseptica]